MIAAGVGSDLVVRHLLDHHADVRSRDKEGRTALDHALLPGHASTVRLLLAHDVPIRDQEATLAAARRMGDSAIVDELRAKFEADAKSDGAAGSGAGSGAGASESKE